MTDSAESDPSRIRDWSSLIEVMSQGVQANNLEGTIIFSNPAHHRMLGYEPGELVGKKVWDMLASEGDKRALRERLRYLVEHQPPPEPYTTRNLRKDGSPVCVQADWSYFRDDNGASTGFVAVISDITKQRSVEKGLRERERELDAIIENIPSMIFVKDAGGLRFVRVNRAAETLLGKTRDELIGRTDYDFFPQERADFFAEKDRRVLESGESEDIAQESIETPDGTRWLHTRKVRILDEAGRPEFLLGISDDITEHKKAEQLLRGYRDDLEKQVNRRTYQLRKTVDLMAGREVRMAELKDTIRILRKQLKDAGLTPAADDPLKSDEFR